MVMEFRFNHIDNNDELNSSVVRAKPTLITDWLRFLPKKMNQIRAAYQRPNSDNVGIIIEDIIYMFNVKTLQQERDYPKLLSYHFNIPKNSRVNTVINTNLGKTYLIYDDVKYVEVDENYFLGKTYDRISEIFPQLPLNVESSFRHWYGNLYFF